MPDRLSSAGFPPIYLQSPGSSFTDLLRASAPELLPGRRALPQGMTAAADFAPHGTTIVAATYGGGVMLAGDRRATMGNVIAQRDIEKVFAADAWSAVGIAGTAGIAIEMVRLFQVELEHYEKIEGATLSLDGKANRLGLMIKGNLSIAMQGLAVVPLYVGYDTDAPDPLGAGRIFGYDVTGGCYEERYFHSIGSGSTFAKSSLKKLWRQDMNREEVVRAIVEALYDAADDDSATGGPDPTRGLFPTAYVIDSEGSRRLEDELIETTARDVIAERTVTFRPHGDGPRS